MTAQEAKKLATIEFEAMATRVRFGMIMKEIQNAAKIGRFNTDFRGTYLNTNEKQWLLSLGYRIREREGLFQVEWE